MHRPIRECLVVVVLLLSAAFVGAILAGQRSQRTRPVAAQATSPPGSISLFHHCADTAMCVGVSAADC
jgi:hypothetical protein